MGIYPAGAFTELGRRTKKIPSLLPEGLCPAWESAPYKQRHLPGKTGRLKAFPAEAQTGQWDGKWVRTTTTREKTFPCLPFLNPTSETASLPTSLPRPYLAASGPSLQLAAAYPYQCCSHSFSILPISAKVTESLRDLFPLRELERRGQSRFSNESEVYLVLGCRCLPGKLCRRQQGMALKKPWITRPRRWECARGLGVCPGAGAGRGVLPQQAKALPLSCSPLSCSLLSMCHRTRKFSKFLFVSKTRGKNIPCCRKWTPQSRGSTALVSRAGRQHPAVTLPQGMIPHPVGALLPCPAPDSSA